MARFSKNDKNVLLYDARNNPLVSKAGVYFSTNEFGQAGKIRPSVIYAGGNTMRDTEETVNMADRRQVVAISRKCMARMAEIEAASNQKADLTVGLGMEPVYLGKSEGYGDAVLKWFDTDFAPNCSFMGVAFDWRSCWKLVSKMLDRDGDILMVLTADRYGQPKIDFILSHRIANRPGQNVVPAGKRFAGYALRDGVVYNSSNSPVGYYILGKSPQDDKVLSTDNAFLIYSPFAFDKGRGLPALAAALKDGLNLQEIDDYITQIIKVESTVYLIEKNDSGRAPSGRTGNPFAAGTTTTSTSTPTDPISEWTFGGTRYVKPNGDIKSLNSNRPAGELMNYIIRLEKRMLAAMEWPHQFLLSPETIGGSMTRGLKVLISNSVSARQQLLEKYALIALQYAISKATVSGGLKATNYGEDFLDWGFTKSAEIILDPGYERAADLADYFAGVKTLEEILAKTGKRQKEFLQKKDREARALADLARNFAKDYPEFAGVALQMFTKRDMVIPPPVDIQQGNKPA